MRRPVLPYRDAVLPLMLSLSKHEDRSVLPSIAEADRS